MVYHCGGCALTFRTRNQRDAHIDDTGHPKHAHECPANACGSVWINDRELWEHMKQCLRLKRTKVNGLHWREAYFFCENCEQLFCGTTAQDDVSCLPPPRSSPALGCELTQSTSASDTRVTGAVPVSRV